MFDAICEDYDVDLDLDEQNFIKDLIRGRPSLSSGRYWAAFQHHGVLVIEQTFDRVPPEKPFLFEIVANNRNGIDVDKWVAYIVVWFIYQPSIRFDYIQRDTHAVGNKMNDVNSRWVESCTLFSIQPDVMHSSLIRSARVIDNEICYADKDWYMVSQLFESRFALHKMIYNHKSCWYNLGLWCLMYWQHLI
jgi:hypothetical protein